MSKEGKLSRNMAVTFINKKKIKTFCLGQEAIALNRKRTEKLIEDQVELEKDIIIEKENNAYNYSQTEQYLSRFINYNYNAHSEYDDNIKKLNETTARLNELIEAQKNNDEFLTLSQRVQELDKSYSALSKAIDSDNRVLQKLEIENKNHQEKLLECENRLKDEEAKLGNRGTYSADVVNTAVEQYNNFISGLTDDGDIMKPDSKDRSYRRKNELEGIIIGGQKAYNRTKKEEDTLPEGLDFEGRYAARKDKIWVDDLQQVREKLKQQTMQYEQIFKNEFILNVYETALKAKRDIDDINKELRKLQFSTQYQFDVALLDDKSNYAKVLRYAEYLKKTNKVDDDQTIIGTVYGYEDDEIEKREAEIKELINNIVEKDYNGDISDFADYRNYMSYEILINNADIKNGKLSKQSGYSSGAGTQIPYTLILSAALSMLYNARLYSTRLIFIDEPFEKMSDNNIKLMLEFFKNQNFQVIFCAPPNKADSIGYECDVIIPVIKIGSNSNMQIGSVRFYDK